MTDIRRHLYRGLSVEIRSDSKYATVYAGKGDATRPVATLIRRGIYARDAAPWTCSLVNVDEADGGNLGGFDMVSVALRAILKALEARVAAAIEACAVAALEAREQPRGRDLGEEHDAHVGPWVYVSNLAWEMQEIAADYALECEMILADDTTTREARAALRQTAKRKRDARALRLAGHIAARIGIR